MYSKFIRIIFCIYNAQAIQLQSIKVLITNIFMLHLINNVININCD